MRRLTTLVAALPLVLGGAAQAQQTSGKQPSAQQALSQSAGLNSIAPRVEAYLRHLYAWGPEYTVSFGAPRESQIPGLYELTVEISKGGRKDGGTLYVSRDGRYLLRGELSDLTKDPLAETQAKIHLEDSPALGPADARVTLVEFADFQCPACRQLYSQLRPLLERYPQARLVFKDFPLSQIHPWARTAALAGRCVYKQSDNAFWKFYDLVYENQELISPENAWAKMMEYASQAGSNTDDLKGCMSGPEAAQAVDRSLQEGQQIGITSTPTVFVNGRPAVGPDPTQIEQYIQYELRSPQQRTKRSN